MFGFPKQSRPQNFHFNKNFLRSITVQLKYSKNTSIIANKKKLIDVLSSKFPNNQELQSTVAELKNVDNKTQFFSKDLGVSGILFQTKDGKKSINFSEDFVVINIAGEAYVNIETLWSELGKETMEILSICGIKELSWISIRKINLIQLELPVGTSPQSGIASIFNNVLVSNFLSIPGNEFLNSGISNIALKNGNNNLNLTLGLIPSEDKTKNMLLDIDLFHTDKKFDTQKMKEKLFEINEEIFNIFNWCLQESAIEQLKK